jgi:uncharacterized membrane protein YgaE (UPF0421/DUF939 family)
MKIGMRNVKTAIAVFICIIISKLLKMEYPFYVVIAAIVSMQNSVTGSYKVGRQRMLGTFIGALVGMFCAFIEPGNAIVSALGIIVVIYFCNKLKWQQSTSIAGIVFIAIMLNIGSKNPLGYSFNRLLDTFIGINVALIVNYFIYPPKYLEKIEMQSKELENSIFEIVKDMIYLKKTPDLEFVQREIDNLDKMLSVYSIEEKSKRDGKFIIANANKVNFGVKKINLHLNIIEGLAYEGIMDKINYDMAKELFKLQLCFLVSSRSETNIIYNYHLANIIGELKGLKQYKDD